MANNNVTNLLICLSGPAQDIEDTLQAMLAQKFVDNAEGAQLDLIGKLVGQSRLGMVDADYRRLVRARISVNRSKGTTEDVITVADLVLGDDAATFHVMNVSRASLVLRVEDVTVTAEEGELMLRMLRDTVAAGVRIILEWGISPEVELFQFDSGPGFNQGKLAAGHD